MDLDFEIKRHAQKYITFNLKVWMPTLQSKFQVQPVQENLPQQQPQNYC